MDIEYLLLLQNFREMSRGIFNGFLLFITQLGEDNYLLIPMALLYWCINKELGLHFNLSNAFARLLNGLFKVMACIYRPWIRDARVVPLDGSKTTATGYSFPSGHSTNASSAYGTIVYDKRKNKVICISMIVLIALVMLSRNYLGVHTPQDVLVGCLTGIFTVIVTDKLLIWESNKQGRDLYILIASIVLAILVIVFAFVKSYPIDYDEAGNILVDPAAMRMDTLRSAGGFIGAILGWFFEKRVVKFEIPETIQEKMQVFLPGIIYTFLLFYVGDSILSLICGNAMGTTIARGICLFFILGLYPYFFNKKIKKNI